MTKKFVKLLLDYINETYTCYYEKAIANNSLYLVIPYLNISSLNDGYLANFDIEIHRSDTSTITIEDIVDSLIDMLDEKTLRMTGYACHFSLEQTNLDKLNETDINERTVSFSSHIFK